MPGLLPLFLLYVRVLIGDTECPLHFYSRESGGIWHVLTASPLCHTVVGSAANMMVVEAT